MDIKEVQGRLKEHFEKALKYINNDDYKTAYKEIYNVMTPDDFEASLTILYNVNEKYTVEPLRKSIVKVYDLLDDYEDKQNLEYYNKINNIDNDR